MAAQKYALVKQNRVSKDTRTFTCTECSRKYEFSKQGGKSYLCPKCTSDRETLQAIEAESRKHKVCKYTDCNSVFVDNTPKLGMDYCTVECRRRAKLQRTGQTPKSGFLVDQVQVCALSTCNKQFKPGVATQVYCSDGCRLQVYSQTKLNLRTKKCRWCKQTFKDTSLKNNQKGHAQCSNVGFRSTRSSVGALYQSPNLFKKRGRRVRAGCGGRLDNIHTMTKHSQSWWGRVSELIYTTYRPQAQDMIIQHGVNAVYDFYDPELGKIDVKGIKQSMTKQGKPVWKVLVEDHKTTCDYIFLIGYTEDKTAIRHLWLIPKEDFTDHLMALSPTSSEYRGRGWEVTHDWGLMTGRTKLTELRALPNPVRPTDRNAYVADPRYFQGDSRTHRGRRAELWYKRHYPDSMDMNVRHGMHHPFDFTDADGTRVDVKSARRSPRQHQPNQLKWSFTCRNQHQRRLLHHQCDVYVCLCLDEGGRFQHEYRIPVTAVGFRRVIHIYQGMGHKWEQYRVN